MVVRNEHLPRIGLSSAQNISSWMYTRLILQNFGLRFRRRVDAYTGLLSFSFLNLLCLSISLGLVAWTIIVNLVVLGIQFLEICLSSSRQLTAFRCGSIQILLLVTASAVYLLVLMVAASRVNDAYDQHKYYMQSLFIVAPVE